MEGPIHTISWEAPEHHHVEKSSDWYWVLGILASAGSVASIIFGNVLFGIVIILGTLVMMLFAYRGPAIIPFEVSKRGIRVGNEIHPFPTLESYYINEAHAHGPQLILKSKKLFAQLLILPLPEEYVEDIELLLASRLPEEFLEESLSHQILEIFGF